MRPGRMPRKYPWLTRHMIWSSNSFNEAGADAPEIPIFLFCRPLTKLIASMRPGRMPRKYRVLPYLARIFATTASMRPGRMPRKYHQVMRTKFLRSPSFNEAGADAPEIPRPKGVDRALQSRFNEAGADAPEIPSVRPAADAGSGEASMRPGRMPRKYHARGVKYNSATVLQ